jgi:hypothetical protein
MYLHMGQFDKAIAAHQKLVTVVPAWKYTLAETYLKAGRKEETLKLPAEIERASDPRYQELRRRLNFPR